jgi:hypothetical protein
MRNSEYQFTERGEGFEHAAREELFAGEDTGFDGIGGANAEANGLELVGSRIMRNACFQASSR